MSDFTELMELYDIERGPGEIDDLMDTLHNYDVLGLVDCYNIERMSNSELLEAMDEIGVSLTELKDCGLIYDPER